MDALKTIYSRRAVRRFTGRKVDKDTVLALIHAAVQAPSAMNVQPWAFAVIQDDGLLRSYSEQTKTLFLKSSELASKTPEFQRMLADPAFDIFYGAGTLIVICAKPIGQHPDWDCCLAAQTLMLAAHARKLATCPVGLVWPLVEQADIKADLNIPADYRAVFPVIVGYPAGGTHVTVRMEPEILCWR